MRKSRCKYCRKSITACGLPAHIHFKHRAAVLVEFRLNPIIQLMSFMEDGYLPGFGDQKQLPAPNPLSIYSTRPLGRMAAPIPEHRVPKGYRLPYGSARPFERIR